MEKLKEIVHYICHRFSNTKGLDLIKLNKICWFSDVDWIFVTTSETLTTFTMYSKKSQGPVLSAIQECLNKLIEEQRVALTANKKYYTSLQEPSLALVSDQEKTVLNFWIEYAQEVSSHKMSEESHDYSWWNTISINSGIPVGLGVLKKNPIKGSLLHYESPIPVQ